MGQKKSKMVKCPICGKLQSTDGKTYFICCKKNHSIIENLYVMEVEKNDVGFSDKAGDEPTEKRTDRNNVDDGKVDSDLSGDTQKEGITFIGGNENMTDNVNESDDYNCADCGAVLVKEQKYCPSCGKELNWEGMK